MSVTSSWVTVAVQSLRNALGVPSTKVSIDVATFFSYVLPLLVCHSMVAVLAIKPRTRTVRVALSPLVVLLTLRAALSVDMSLGEIDLNICFMIFLFAVVGRTLDWASMKGPLVRHLRPANSTPSTVMDVLDLLGNHRGLGWDWSRYQSYTPRDTRPTHRITFVLYVSLSAVAHALISGAFHRAALALAPGGVGSTPRGSTIFDETLPFLVRYLRAGVISAFTAFAVYAGAQMSYDLLTIPGVLIFGQDPVQWPPAFNAPWRATSLSDFWGQRWHQWVRRTFLILGGYPLSMMLGPPGLIIGSFLVSGIMHHIAMITLNSQVEMWWMVVGFGMMGPGVVVEHAFRRLTGRRVDGVWGWVWTITWLFLWGNLIVEGFARAGLFGYAKFDSLLPVRISLVEHWVADLDAWLHAIY